MLIFFMWDTCFLQGQNLNAALIFIMGDKCFIRRPKLCGINIYIFHLVRKKHLSPMMKVRVALRFYSYMYKYIQIYTHTI